MRTPEGRRAAVAEIITDLWPHRQSRQAAERIEALYVADFSADPQSRAATPVEMEVRSARMAAHVKHGEKSIEKLSSVDRAWLPVLVEEIGEVANAMTYDGAADMRAELIDVMAVASAWIDALDRSEQ